MLRSATVAAFALVAALSACSEASNGPSTGRSPEPSGDPATSLPVTASPPTGDPAKILDRAVDAMAAEPVTGFEFEMHLGGESVIHIAGRAQTDRWEATGNFTAPGESSPSVMRARSVGDAGWMQMRDWPPAAAGCWLEMNGQAPLGIQALTAREPLYISLLAYLRAADFAESPRNTLAGSLNLAAAIGLLQAQLFENIEVTESQIAAAKVPVAIGYDHLRITRVEMSGPDVLTAIEDAGGEVTSISRTTLENTDYTVSYPIQVAVADVVPPPNNLAMTDPSTGCH